MQPNHAKSPDSGMARQIVDANGRPRICAGEYAHTIMCTQAQRSGFMADEMDLGSDGNFWLRDDSQMRLSLRRRGLDVPGAELVASVSEYHRRGVCARRAGVGHFR